MMHDLPVSNILLILATALLVYLLFLAHAEFPSPQSLANLQFASDPSYLSALSQYPKYWPPFYPTVLWLTSQAAIPPRYFNLSCFYISLFLIGALSKLLAPNIHWLYVVLFIALLNANYVNTYQQVAEPLFVLLALIIMFLLVVARSPWTLPKAALLAVLSSLSCLTRFFAVFWQLPLCLAYICLNHGPSTFRKRLVPAALFCSIVILLVFPWLVTLRLSTGSFSGMDRFAPRGIYYINGQRLPIAHVATLNAKFLAKTVFIDFLSPYRYASHGDVRASLRPSEIAIGVPALFLLSLVALVLMSSFYHLFKHNPVSEAPRVLASRHMVPIYFTVAYLLCLMILWSLGNNDPIYTRFAYPAYPLALFSLFVLYSWIKSFNPSLLRRLPFYLLYLLVGGINALKAYVWWAKTL